MKTSYYVYQENEECEIEKCIEILAENYEDAILYFENNFDNEIWGLTTCAFDNNCKSFNPSETREI